MIFWIPIIASTVLLVFSWRDLSGRQLAVLIGWWLIASYLLLYGGSPTRWVLGLLAHVVLAIYLSIRWKLEI